MTRWSSRWFAWLAALPLVTPHAHAAEMVHIPATRDATLIEDPDGARANGSGPALFAGRTAQGENGLRRAVLRFDVAAAVPRQALIRRAFLTLHLTPSNGVPADVAVHRLLEDWSEGPSFSAGGAGTAAQAGDCTWLHRDYDQQFWVVPGGQFVADPSATLAVEGEDYYTWPSGQQLIADVRLWLKAPDRNFGWILLGDEATPQSAKRFDSRESQTPAFRPVLTVEYERPGRERAGLPAAY